MQQACCDYNADVTGQRPMVAIVIKKKQRRRFKARPASLTVGRLDQLNGALRRLRVLGLGFGRLGSVNHSQWHGLTPSSGWPLKDEKFLIEALLSCKFFVKPSRTVPINPNKSPVLPRLHREGWEFYKRTMPMKTQQTDCPPMLAVAISLALSGMLIGSTEAAALDNAEMGLTAQPSVSDASIATSQSAQQNSADQPDSEDDEREAEQEDVERMVVTGSRIKRAGYDTLQPAVSLSSEFIEDRGFANVADALNETPAFGIGVGNTGRQGGQSVGQNFVDTFGLGTQRTLVLINGRRSVSQNTPGLGSGASSGQQVDLNIIPTSMIERVETVFVGGAPVYGTDAIAGTVNLIMKEDFEGLSTDVQYGTDEAGDSQNARFSGLWGANTADNKGNVTLAAEFSTVGGFDAEDSAVLRRNTAFCENPEAGIGANGLPIVNANDGIPDVVLCDDAVNVWQVPNSGMPLLPGAFVAFGNGNGALRDAQGNPLVFDASGNLVTWEEANLGTPRGIFFSKGADGFNNPLVFPLVKAETPIAPLDRWNFMGNAHYEITDNTQLFVEGLYARSESTDRSNQPPWSSNVFAPGAGGAIQVNIDENPFVSQELRSTLALNGAYDPTLEEDQFFQLTRSNYDIVEGAPNFRDQDVFRFVVGLEGDFDFVGRNWSWNTAFNYGETNATSRQTDINGPRYALALDAVTNPETGEIVCRSQIEPTATPFDGVFTPPANSDIDNCIPFNPFGLQQISDEQRAYLIQQNFQSTEIRQITYEGNFAGEVLDLPAGPISLAGGFTHRRESGRFDVDRATNIGIDPVTPVPNVSGKFNTTEFYGETVIPIVENGIGPGFDVPFLASFQLESAFRLVDNSRAGQDVTWTAGGRLRPNLPFLEDGLTIRGNFTKSIRAPSIQELFLPRSEIQTFAEDPCDPEYIIAGPDPALRQANCEAQAQALIAQGVLEEGFNLADFESLIDNRTDSGFTGGNAELENEVADSWTIGAVVAPPALPGLSLSVDWVNISLADEIVTLSATQVLNACFDSQSYPNAEACDRFERDSGFQIRNPETGFLNAARREFRGLVANFNYNFEAADLVDSMPGNFQFFGNFFHNARVEREVSRGDLEILTGERGFERLRYQLNLRYDQQRFGFLWQMRHIGSFKVDKQAAPERFAPGEGTGPSVQFHNLTFDYQLSESIKLQAVVNNVFDQVDGRVRAGAALTGSGSDPFQPLDVIGRRFRLAASVDF